VRLRPEELRLRTRLAVSLKRERKRLGWTQEEAAERAEMYLRHYQKLESGSVNVTIRTLSRLCRGFGIDPQRLFEP
jgi:transcriptional regulator with XRE-family HTH domain